MKKNKYGSLFALSTMLAGTAYSASFNDYVNYELGENRELSIKYSSGFALFGVTDPGTSYGFQVMNTGHLGTMAEIGLPDYGLHIGVGGYVYVGFMPDIHNGYGDYSINPSSISNLPDNDVVYTIQPIAPNYVKVTGLRLILDNDGTGAAKGFFIENNQNVELDGTTVEYRGVKEGIYVDNNASLLMKNSELIYANTSGDSYGIYALGNGAVEIDSSSFVLVKGDVAGVGIKNNSGLTVDGLVVTERGAAVMANSSNVEINGMLLTYNADKAVDSENSKFVNNGDILIELDNNGTALYAKNNTETKNYGTITSYDNVVNIIPGTNQFSGHFTNYGTITARSSGGTAIEFGNGEGVLELMSSSAINGKIEGGAGEKILVNNANTVFGDVNNFTKIVSHGNSVINSTVNLKPAVNSDVYYTSAFSGAKSVSTDLASDTSVGNLVINGTVNIGVDYDGIDFETDKTGKIIAGSVTLNNGKIVLINAGNTTRNIIEEAMQTSEKAEVRIKNIIISNKLQAVDPNFSFEVTGGLQETAGWTKETVSRVENGLTVVDQVYKTNSALGPDPEVFEKLNPVPRNRVDLDNADRMSWASERFLNMETKDMNPGERRQSIEYIGLKSNFEAENKYNYDYDADTNGIMGTTLHKHTENLYSGFTLGYTDNNVSYSNNDNEKVKSFNINVFGRYETGNFDVDTHVQYGYNEHELEADWLGEGGKESSYNSHVVKGGVTAGYNQELGPNLKVRPNVGVDYVYVKEGVITTDGMDNIESTSGKGFVGKAGVDIGNTEGKLRWNAGVGYKQNFTDTFHETRDMSNDYKMEKLDYGKGAVTASADVDYKITEKFSVKAGYEYEKNDNFENHNVKAGFSFILGEK